MAESIVKKLIDARDPDAVKLWADAVYQQLLALLGVDTAGSSSSSVGAAVINSIQRGTISITGTNTSNTSTITSVDTTKTELRILGQSNTTGSVASMAYLVLANATTITATRISSSSGTTTVSWELTEYE